MSPRKRNALYARAQELAEARATKWAVYVTDSKGNRLTGWRLVTARSTEAALKRGGRRAIAASPVLSSREWRGIYGEVGL